MIKIVYCFHVQYLLFLSDFDETNFLSRFSIKKLMKERQVGAESFQADRQKGRHDTGNSRFQNFRNVPKYEMNFEEIC